MSVLKIYQGTQCHSIEFEGESSLQKLLQSAGCAQAQPCGGRGKCGKCAIMLSGNVSEPNAAETAYGVRLSCQAVIFADSEVYLPENRTAMQIETGSAGKAALQHPMKGPYGAAVDIGTTTLVLKLFNLKTGEVSATSAMINPQTTVAADVVGRIDAAMNGRGEYLRQQIISAIETMLHQACSQAEIQPSEVGSLSIAGNTTMLYLLTGRDTSSLASAPFASDCLFDEEIECLERIAYLPPCLHAFVGADISCAVLASGMCDRNESALLCDIGTNGEIALWHEDKLYISSTAAGPAFEGAGIECGSGCVSGAIDSVEIMDGCIRCHTVGVDSASSICGSGLLDAIAALLKLEIIDETGAMEESPFILKDKVFISQADVRAVQLAKSAIAAGVECLIEAAGCRMEDIKTLYLCGGFGSHLNLRSVGEIGLLPEQLLDKVTVLGNASLSGAISLLFDQGMRSEIRSIAEKAQHVNLGGSASFNEKYIDNMFFGE